MATVASTPRPTLLDKARAAYDRRLTAAADRLHRRGDTLARTNGWDVYRVGRTQRMYRDPRFNTLGGAR